MFHAAIVNEVTVWNKSPLCISINPMVAHRTIKIQVRSLVNSPCLDVGFVPLDVIIHTSQCVFPVKSFTVVNCTLYAIEVIAFPAPDPSNPCEVNFYISVDTQMLHYTRASFRSVYAIATGQTSATPATTNLES